MFDTKLSVTHLHGHRWTLTDPLIWEGRDELLVIRSGFETDFASIPKVMRWLLDSAGLNSEAGVLHDAVWRESQRTPTRVDPADADGIFRRALRETGSSALTRALMWGGVRAAAIAHGRYGREGPRAIVKLGQLAGVFVLALFTALLPTLVAAVGLAIYWVANWIISVLWYPFERRRFPGFETNWPWFPHGKAPAHTGALPIEYLEVLALDSAPAVAIKAAIIDERIDDADIESILAAHRP